MNDNQSEEPEFESFAERISAIESVHNASTLVQQIARNADGLVRWQRSRLILEVMRSAIELSVEDISFSIQLIVDDIVPLCLEDTVSSDTDHEVGNGQTSHDLRELRNALSEWVHRFPIDYRTDLVDELHERLRKELLQNPRIVVLQVISAIGYRSDMIVSVLFDMIRQNNKLSQDAMGTVISLGVRENDRGSIFEIARSHLKEHGSCKSVRRVVNALCGPEEMDIVLQLLGTADQLNSHDRLFTLTAVASAIDRCPSDSTLHDSVWRQMREYRDTIDMNSQFAFGCDTSETVADYLRWIAEGPNASASARDVEITRLRIDDLFKPNQLDGFDTANTNAVRECMRDFATKDTRMEGKFVTSELRSKCSAWEILQCLNDECLDPLLFQAVCCETNPSAAHAVALSASSARLESLPVEILKRIRTAEPVGTDDGDDHLFRQLAFVELAHASGTREAFDAMLDFGYLHQGDVLQSFVQAIVDLAVERKRQGDTDVIEKIIAMADVGQSQHHRSAAVSAFSQLMIAGKVPIEYQRHALIFFQDESLDTRAHQNALQAIAYSDTPLSASQQNRIRSVAHGEFDDLAWRSWELLVRRGWVNQTDHRGLFSRLGMTEGDGGPHFHDAGKITAWQAFMTGLLFQSDNQRFSNPLQQILDRSRIDCVYQVINPLEQQRLDLQDRIIDALAGRVIKCNSRGSADTELIAALGRIAPTKLFDVAENVDWSEWMDAGRYALCISVAAAGSVDTECLHAASELLLEFMRDASFKVRRAAYRSLARLDGELLVNVLQAWSQATNAELTMRSAEGVRWIPLDNATDDDIVSLGLTWHADPEVRKLARNAVVDRRNQSWGERYLERIIDSAASDSVDPDVCRCSRALVSLGDDDTIDRIQKALVGLELVPRTRKLLSKTLRDLEKDWKQRSSKWAEPWTHATGTLECLDGAIRDKSGTEQDVRIWLWRQQRRTQSEKYSWGGTIEQPEHHSSWMSLPDEVELVIKGRPTRTVIISGGTHGISRPSRATFFGDSAYPEAAE